MATGYLHGVLESIPGNETNSPTPSTKVWYGPVISFNPQLHAAHMERDDELRGIDEPLSVVPEQFNPTWDAESRLYPDTIGFLLSIICGLPTTAAGDGIITDPDVATIPAGAYRHVWTAPFGPVGLNPKTAQFQAAYRDQATFFKLKGCGCSQLAISSPAQGGARVTASGPALYMARISDPSLTPAYESLATLPFMRGHLTLPTWLASTATTEDFTLQIANTMEPVRTLGIASKFADDLEKGDPPIIVTGTVPKRLVDADDYDALLNATGFATKVRWLSTVNITGSYKYALWVQMTNAQYTDGGPQALANRRRIGGTFNWKATNATGTAGHVTITLVNNVTSYV